MSGTLKKRILSTSMLVAPAALVLLSSQPSYADCSVTSGGGTVGNPANGAVIDCVTTMGNQTTTVGNSSAGIGATVNVQDNAIIAVTGDNEAIDIEDVTVTLGDNSQVTAGGAGQKYNSHGVAAYAAASDASATVTLSGDNSLISVVSRYGKGVAVVNTAGAGDVSAVVTLSGDNSAITAAGDKYGTGIRASNIGTGSSSATVELSGTNSRIFAASNMGMAVSSAAGGDAIATVTLSGAGSLIDSNTSYGMRVYGRAPGFDAIANVTLSGDSSRIDSSSHGVVVRTNASSVDTNLSLLLSGNNSQIQSALFDGVFVDTNNAAGNSTIDVDLSGVGANISTVGANGEGISVDNLGSALNSNVVLSGDSSFISTANTTAEGIWLNNAAGTINSTLVLSGDNSQISVTGGSSTGVFLSGQASVDSSVTLSGDSAQISATSLGVQARSIGSNVTSVVALSGANSQISSTGTGVYVYGSTGNNATVTLSGANSQISTLGASARGVYVYGTNTSDTTVTLSGASSQIYTQGANSYGIMSYGFGGTHDVNVTLSGDNSRIYTTGNVAHGMYVYGGTSSSTVTLSGANSQINAQGLGAHGINMFYGAGTSTGNITLGSGTSIISAQAIGVRILGGAGTNPNTTIDSAGLIQGGTNSILLDDGDDNLTLRTGSNLTSPTGADLGAGTDTITLVGNGNEDEIFLNVENLNVNADITGWALTADSDFTDININNGVFLSNAADLDVSNAVNVNAGGTLSGTGVTDGNVNINAGGFWRGTGTVDGVVTNDGTVAPGNSIGTLNVNGSFVQNAGSVLEIEVDDAGNSDIIAVTGAPGTAILNDNSTVHFTPFNSGPIADGQVYTFITTTGGSTLGMNVNSTDSFAFVDFTLQDVGNNIQATANLAPSTSLLGQNGNEIAVEEAINTLINNGQADSIASILTVLDAESQQSNDFLSSQSGSIVVTSVDSASLAMESVNNVVRGRFPAAPISIVGARTTGLAAGDDLADIKPAAGEDKTPIPRPARKPTSYWAQAVGGFGHVKGDNQSRGATYRTYGMALGADTTLDNLDAHLGVFAGFSNTNSDVEDLSDDASVQVYQLGLYGSHNFDDRYRINGSLSGAFLDFETERQTLAGKADADFNGIGGFGYVEALYDIKDSAGITYSPYAGLEGGVIYHESYRESGADILNLDVESETTTQLSSEVGLQVSGINRTENHVHNQSVRVGWGHEFLDQSSTRAKFSSAPSAVFESQGPEQKKNSLKLGLDLNITGYQDHSAFYLNYDGNVAVESQDHLFTTGIKIQW